MLKAKDLRSESSDELVSRMETLKSEIYQLCSEKLDSKSQKTHLIGQKRKEVARILTIIREKEIEGIA
jgi:large subunit ribosomal protein L29